METNETNTIFFQAFLMGMEERIDDQGKIIEHFDCEELDCEGFNSHAKFSDLRMLAMHVCNYLDCELGDLVIDDDCLDFSRIVVGKGDILTRKSYRAPISKMAYQDVDLTTEPDFLWED